MSGSPVTIPSTRSEGWRRPIVRRSIAGVLVLVAVVVGTLAGVAGLLLTAAAVATVPVFLLAGLVVLFVTTAALAWLALRVGGTGRARPGGLLIGGAWSVMIVVLASVTILQSFGRQPSYPVPDGVAFWELQDGTKLAYVHAPAVGARRPTPVVFLHGGPGTPGEGLPLGTAELTAAGFDVYRYDQIGAGRSTRLDDLDDYTVERNVADLEAVRERIGAEQMVLVGQSWGGTLAAQYLAAHPDRVARVAFTSPGEIWPDAVGEGEDSSPWDELEGEQRARYEELTSDPRFILQAVLLSVNPAAAHAFVGDAEADSRLHEIAVAGKDSGLCPGEVGDDDTHHNLQGFYANQMTNRDFETIDDPRPVLRNLDTPALVMRGECDFVLWEDTREYRDTLPDATLVYVPGAGHSISGGAPEAYIATITAFALGESLPLEAYTGDADPAG